MGMKKIGALVLGSVLAASFAGAVTLDEIGAGFLGDPRVQIDLGITAAQRNTVASRRVKSMFRLVFVMALTTKAADNGYYDKKHEEDAGLNVNWDSTSYELGVSDLTGTQKLRLRELALQLSPSVALTTSEAQLALGLTSEQIARLEAIFPPHDTVNRPGPMLDAMLELKKQIEDGLASVDKPDFAVSKAIKAFDKTMDGVYAKLAAETKRTDSRWDGSDLKHKVLAILTPAQRKRLTELQGKPLR